MRTMLSVAVILGVVLTAAHVRAEEEEFQEPEPPTDAQIKKMKMKELKTFLSDRGQPCNDCFEKGDYVQVVKKHRAAKLLPSKRPRKVSKEPAEKQWKKITEELGSEMGLEAEALKKLAKVVSLSFEQHTRSVAKTMHTDKLVIARTSTTEPYVESMTRRIKAAAKWIKKENIVKQDAIRKRLDEPIKMFITQVAAKNPNPSYEHLSSKDEL